MQPYLSWLPFVTCHCSHTPLSHPSATPSRQGHPIAPHRGQVHPVRDSGCSSSYNYVFLCCFETLNWIKWMGITQSISLIIIPDKKLINRIKGVVLGKIATYVSFSSFHCFLPFPLFSAFLCSTQSFSILLFSLLFLPPISIELPVCYYGLPSSCLQSRRRVI